MLADVRRILRQLAGAAVSLQNAAGAGRAFELLLMTGIAGELQKRGYSVYLLRSDGVKQVPGSTPITFIQRSGVPGGIRPLVNGANGPTSIVFQKSSSLIEWEIWNGIEFVGRSGGTHEFDLAIVPKQLGDDLRSTGGRPFGHGWISIECKDVGANGSPDEMRAFLARIYDTTLLSLHAQYLGAGGALNRVHPLDPTQPGFGAVSATYRIENTETYNAIARRTGFTQGTVGMSNYYFIRRFDNIRSGSQNLTDLKNEICDWIDQNLPDNL
jgi:hypothetical protein